MNNNIFFYSASCKYSYNLMKLLSNMNYLNNFKLINTDNNNNLPSQITRTPTLIVAGLPKMLECDEAFKWVNGLIQIKKNQNQSQVLLKNQKNIFLMSELMNINKNNNDPREADIINFSDLFTFVDNNNVSQNHNFTDPNKKDNYMFTAPEMKKISEKEQTKLLLEKVKNRDEQDKYYKEYMKKFIDDETLKKYNENKISKQDINKKIEEQKKKKLLIKQMMNQKKNNNASSQKNKKNGFYY